jgi:hypothetical protein
MNLTFFVVLYINKCCSFYSLLKLTLFQCSPGPQGNSWYLPHMQTKYLSQSCAELKSPALHEPLFLILKNSATVQYDQYTYLILTELYLFYQMFHFKQYQNFKILLVETVTPFETGFRIIFKYYICKEGVVSAMRFHGPLLVTNLRLVLWHCSLVFFTCLILKFWFEIFFIGTLLRNCNQVVLNNVHIKIKR